MGAFHTHIADAIRINKERKPRYAALTGGRSRRVSSLLIWFERACIPFALWVDWRARRFQRRGIPVVEDAFVSMERILPLETPPRLRARAGDADFAVAGRALADYRAALRAALGSADFGRAAAASHEVLIAVDALEGRCGAAFAMTRHFAESIGLGALNAATHAERTGGETARFSRGFLAIQALGLPSVLLFDRWAQEIHALGAGIVVNDIPEIPFRERYAAAGLGRHE